MPDSTKPLNLHKTIIKNIFKINKIIIQFDF